MDNVVGLFLLQKTQPQVEQRRQRLALLLQKLEQHQRHEHLKGREGGKVGYDQERFDDFPCCFL